MQEENFATFDMEFEPIPFLLLSLLRKFHILLELLEKYEK